MKRRLTYPFLSMQTEIKKTCVPLVALMSLCFYLALQLFPVTWRHVVWQPWLPHCWRQHHILCIFFFFFWGGGEVGKRGGVWFEFSKMLMKINEATQQNPLFLPQRLASFLLLLIPKSLVISYILLLSHLPSDLLVNPVSSIPNLITSLPFHFFNSSTTDLFPLLLDLVSGSEPCCCPSQRDKAS